MGEFEFIDAIKAMFGAIGGKLPDGAIEGIGDDCAVLPLGGGRAMALTTDMLCEGVHFLRGAATARAIGRKSLAVNLSDVAAMGARPVASLLSLSLPADCTGRWAREFMEGYRELSEQFSVALIGGDTTGSKGGITINVTAIGIAPMGNIKRRSAAREGDSIFVCGRLGESAAGLRDVLTGRYDTPAAMAHHDPVPQVEQGVWLGEQADVHAMIDLSDGLASDLEHILRASGVGARIELDAIPTLHTLDDALAGGEDYKLLFTAPSGVAEHYRARLGELYAVGRIVGGDPRVKWLRGGRPTEYKGRGFRHF